MAKQLIVDLYECNEKLLNDGDQLKNIARNLVNSIGASIVEENIKLFDPIGITYFAIISTSHFSIHTWPENGYAAVDLFSCGYFDEDLVCQRLKEYFKAGQIKNTVIERRIESK